MVITTLTPAVLQVLWDKRDAPEPATTGPAIGRGVAPLPEAGRRSPAVRSTSEPDARSCDHSGDPAQAGQHVGHERDAVGPLQQLALAIAELDAGQRHDLDVAGRRLARSNSVRIL